MVVALTLEAVEVLVDICGSSSFKRAAWRQGVALYRGGEAAAALEGKAVGMCRWRNYCFGGVSAYVEGGKHSGCLR